MIDEFIYKAPIVGKKLRIIYAFFKNNIAFADFIHTIFGIGIGFLLVNKWVLAGVLLILISGIGHIYAYVMGKNYLAMNTKRR